MRDRARSLNWKSRLYCSHTDHEGILYHVKMTKFATRNKQSMITSSTHVKKNFQMNTFHNGLKSWIDLYRHSACPGSYLKYAFSINKEKYDNRIRESPWQSLYYLICIITVGCAPTMYGFLMMKSQQSGSPIGGEGNSQTSHSSIVVQCQALHKLL